MTEKMVDRRYARNFDWLVFSMVICLLAVGAFTLYSAVTVGSGAPQTYIFYKQISWYVISFCVMAVVVAVDYRFINKWAYVIYGGVVLLLVLVLVKGDYIAGARRWLSLGPFSLQPSELAKIAIIIALAHYFSKVKGPQGFKFLDLIPAAVLVGVPFLLVLKQPDLGTALMLLLIAGCIAFVAKIERKTFIVLIAAVVVMAVALFFTLEDYQMTRVSIFLNPGQDPLGAGYHIIQSKIAIGSGMLLGKGYLHGPQNALDFLPEEHTDFIFAVLAEEWGLVGASIVLLLFLILIFSSVNVALRAKDPFCVLIAAGVAALIFWQVLINICMTMGLMPVVGVPLPFISYGGSSLLTMSIGVGLVLNVSMRRFKYK